MFGEQGPHKALLRHAAHKLESLAKTAKTGTQKPGQIYFSRRLEILSLTAFFFLNNLSSYSLSSPVNYQFIVNSHTIYLLPGNQRLSAYKQIICVAKQLYFK